MEFEVDLEVIDSGEWFPWQDSRFDQQTGEWIFDKPITDGPRVRVRLMHSFIQERMNKRKKVAEHVHNPKSRSMERITYFEEPSAEAAQKEIDDTWDYAITGIECIKNKKTGEVIKCTRENKLKLLKVPAFDRFIGRCLKILEGSEAKVKEETEKNLQTG